MKFSRFITSLLFLLPLTSQATPVTYTIGNGYDILLQLTVADYIPNLATDTPNHWTFPASAFYARTCSSPIYGPENCTNLDVDIAPFDPGASSSTATFAFSYYAPLDPSKTVKTEGYGGFLSTDLSTPGRYEEGVRELFVDGPSPVTPTPEPATVCLAGSSLLLLGWLRFRNQKSAARV